MRPIFPGISTILAVAPPVLLALLSMQGARKPAAPPKSAGDGFPGVRAVLQKRCLPCHNAKAKQGGLDLERFRTTDAIRKDPKPWSALLEQVHAGQMPPSGSAPLTASEKNRLLDWTRAFLDAEARARADDPGVTPLRRLSNSEYDATIRDLTGIDLRPTREFPPDGAGGEGFTNASEALTDISPTLLGKYLAAAKEVADHAVFTPTGMRFSPAKTRRDWSDEGVSRLRAFYASVAPADGRFDPAPYLRATLVHRDALRKGTTTVAQLAAREKINARYLKTLWNVLQDRNLTVGPLGALRSRWIAAKPEDLPGLVSLVNGLRDSLWTEVRIGNYVRNEGGGYAESLTRQRPVDPPAVPSLSVRAEVKPVPGQAEVRVALVSREIGPTTPGSRVVWKRPRLESPGKPPLLLKDYPSYGPRYETVPTALYQNASAYLAALADAGAEPDQISKLASARGLDAALLGRWNALAGIRRGADTVEPFRLGKAVRTVPLRSLDEKFADDGGRKGISGWRKTGTDLPAVISNATDDDLRIPGLARAHRVVMHPLPTEFVAIVWTSPLDAVVTLDTRIAHAHPDCGNGVAWFVEHRRGERSTLLFEDRVALGGASQAPKLRMRVAKGDQVVVAVDAKDGDHGCDLTDVAVHLVEQGGDRAWDLAGDVADTIGAGNPHADRLSNPGVWSFASGPSRSVAAGAAPLIPQDSVLGKWQAAVSGIGDPGAAAGLANQVQALLSGSRPAVAGPDQALYDQWVAVDSPLFDGVDVVRLAGRKPDSEPLGLPANRFDPEGNVTAETGSAVVIRLPAALLSGRTLVAEGTVDGPMGNRAVRFQIGAPDVASAGWTGPVVADPKGRRYASLRAANDAFRDLFPRYLCFPAVIPTDEVVSLKMFHREDGPLAKFLDPKAAATLERLWDEHRYVSRQAVAEEAYLPQFIGFVSQDQPKTMLTYFENQRPVFQKRRMAWEAEARQAAPRQLDAVIAFASHAFRRPLSPAESKGLRALHADLLARKVDHETALRAVLARVLSSPAYLFRIEAAPPNGGTRRISDWELASRLSYFIWSSMPDATLRSLAASGKLHEPAVLKAQLRRMLRDPRSRALAVEFGAQSLHVRGFDTYDEKNERLFPTFTPELRAAIYEETIRFFEDFFRSNRPVADLIDADHAFLNETLARHYAIPQVSGPQWRRVDGVRRYGRGGILTLASVQTKEAAASRTSPVLRGNWISETLLGEKLPRPPANVPKLPEEQASDASLTVRQLTEKHTKDPACWSCHQRIDPIGFTFERYDAIGRLRTRDSAGLPIDTRTVLRDGTRLDGIDGLRGWLRTKQWPTVVRVFCRRLLGYALGRATTLSDTVLIDRMAAAVQAKGGRISDALDLLVQSPQFQKVRAGDGSSIPGTIAMSVKTRGDERR